ncbi:MAG: YggS family pyridoxal phosphate-dependent enzyme [Micavibrio aeruginosavorus]|uniref:Pyridoxal phosphate homeostasis protein n=1 Tax=Micavibrio aeruginosavorus TaxID=349221 RepID=A0A7T5UHW3_9BACT|nr:MAG: YggS family pyridoxal phosphate-dependent enzyme [Micavibrio aeruginosavorus]
MTDISENLRTIRNKIAKAACESGRRPEDVQLVAVSKMQPLERIEAALQAGQRVFGENRVQEAQAHWAGMKAEYPEIVLHLIGPLQTNKAREAVGLFDVIETVDRPALVPVLAKEMRRQGRFLPCFIQVNTGEEPQKSGVSPQELTSLLDLCCEHGLAVEGLMCLPPVTEPPALHFAFLQKLAREHHLENLSMGMSVDFEKAIPLGATYVRVGTALFGER